MPGADPDGSSSSTREPQSKMVTVVEPHSTPSPPRRAMGSVNRRTVNPTRSRYRARRPILGKSSAVSVGGSPSGADAANTGPLGAPTGSASEAAPDAESGDHRGAIK